MENRHTFSKNLDQHYVYNIIINYWREGGTSKIHSAEKGYRYMTELVGRAWIVALDDFFEWFMLRAEKRNIANPKGEEYVVLNCIYLNTFTAMETGCQSAALPTSVICWN